MTETERPEFETSPVFELRAGPATAVGRRESRLSLLPGLGLAGVIGLIVFSSLSHGRAAKAQTAPPTRSTTVAAPIAAQPSPVQSPPFAAAPATAPAVTPSGPSPEDLAHWQAPAMVVDLAEAQVPAPAPAGLAATSPTPSDAKAGGTAEERFAARVGATSVETAHASRLGDLALVAPQGTVIPAILETAINSDLPGFVRAVVSRDVRGFDGSTVVIPRGSKLIGQYRSAVAAGQTRAFVVWSRVITPQGVSVDIASPSADTLGRGGLEGETNNHFLRRFGASILLSVLSSGLQALGADNRSDTAIVIGSPQQATSIASIALQKEIDIPTTIQVRQGAPIRVFVARDLDFTAVMGHGR